MKLSDVAIMLAVGAVVFGAGYWIMRQRQSAAAGAPAPIAGAFWPAQWEAFIDKPV